MYTSQPVKKFRPRFISAETENNNTWKFFNECTLSLVPVKLGTEDEKKENEKEVKREIISLDSNSGMSNPAGNNRMNLLFLCDEKPRPLNLDFRTLSSLPELRTYSYPEPRSLKRSSPSASPSVAPEPTITTTTKAAAPESIIDLSNIIPSKKRFCIKQPKPQKPPQPLHPVHIQPPQQTSDILIHVLYAEDSEVCRKFVKMTISPLSSVQVDTARDGLDCCKKIEENPKHYQLILMDLIMPEMSGINATIRIRNLGCTIPIIALTGDQNSILMKQECDIAGMNGFIEKPLTLSRFKSILSEQNIIGS